MRKFVFIEKLPSGNYSVRYWEDTHFKREWFEDYGLAKRRAADLTLKLMAKKQGAIDPTLSPLDIYNHYIESIRHTHRAKTIGLKDSHAKPFFTSSQHITDTRIKEYKAEQLAKVSVSTVSIRLREIRAVCNWARKEGYLADNLFEHIEIPAAREAGIKLSIEEIKKIWNASDAIFRPYLGFLIYTGARYNEIFQIQWHHLDLENGVWKIPAENCKTNKERHVPLNDLLLSVLQVMPKTDDFLFPKWGKNAARWYLAKACRKAGVKTPRVHDFRHTFASHWTGDTRKLQDMLGWTTGAMLKRYSHFTVEDIRKEANSRGIGSSLQIKP
jgi:integrase